ncbi:MAG: hypothetical protein EHM21_13525, partial [Chloroflexi bacterium]
MANDDSPERQPAGAEPDPIAGRSLSGPILICTVLLFLSLAWALLDELALDRPWKRYQQRFTKLYTAYLQKLGPRQAAAEKAVYASPEFQKIEAQLKAAE